MNISPVNHTSSSRQKYKNIGTAAGFTAGGLYILKSGKDLFVDTVKNNRGNLSKNKAMAISAAVAGAVISGTALIGRILGSGIGRIVDKQNEKKLLNDSIGDIAREIVNDPNVKKMTVDELEEQLK